MGGPILEASRRDFLSGLTIGAFGHLPFARGEAPRIDLARATLAFHRTGTSNPLTIYSDPQCSQACGAVVTADATGRFPAVYLDGAETYRAVLRNASGAVLFDVDPVVQASAAATSFAQAGPSAVPRTVQDRLRESLSLADFGYRGDGRADDTEAWQRTIAVAAAEGVAEIQVPWGASGVSVVSGQIVNGKLPPGLRFVGRGGGAGSFHADRVKLLYTGSGVCWNISYPDYAPYETGDWSWEHMIFDATNHNGTMFSFNDPLTHNPVDGVGYSYLRNICFRNVSASGAGKVRDDAGRQNGDFLRGTKLFHLEMDGQCMVSGWRRGLWLKGCDNSRISARFIQNNRHIMMERSGSFGNNNLIDSRFLGPITIGGTEDPYLLWDGGFGTTVLAPFLEETDGARAQARALVFLDGFGARLIAPLLSGAPVLRLGPNARECVVDQPSSTRYDEGWNAIVDAPASWDFGYNQGDYRLIVRDARENMQRMMGIHPRIAYVNSTKGYEARPDQSRAKSAGPAGVQDRTHLCHGLDYWGRSQDTAVGGGIGGIVAEAAASHGYGIKLNARTANAGFELRFVVGQDLLPGWFNLSHRTRHAAAERDVNWGVVLLVNGRLYMALHPGISHTAYESMSGTIDGTGWAAGDIILVRAYSSNPQHDLFIDFIELRPVAPPIADLALAAVTGVDGAGASAASKADVDSRFTELEAKINAILAQTGTRSTA